MKATLAVIILAAARTVAAVGCATHTFGTCDDGITHWYDPDDGQICDPLDCGGGRAPPKSTVPCCPAYTGTEPCVTTPSYLPCFAKAASSTAAPSQSTASNDPTTITSDASSTSTPSATLLATGSALTTDVSTSGATRTGGTSAGSGTSRTSSSALASATSNLAGHLQYDSLMALAGAAMGAVLL